MGGLSLSWQTNSSSFVRACIRILSRTAQLEKGDTMRIRPFVTGAVFGALAMTCASLSEDAAAAPSRAMVQSLGPASQDAITHFSVYLPLSHTAALEQLLKEQT